jgi:hypothetical protein
LIERDQEVSLGCRVRRDLVTFRRKDWESRQFERRKDAPENDTGWFVKEQTATLVNGHRRQS